MSEREVILEAKDVTKVFRTTKGRPLTANDKVSLKIYKGETLGIAGESGCGKSTFIRMVSLLETPTSGEILFRGRNVADLKGEARRQNCRHVQMVFQDPGAAFSPRMKIKDIICESLRNFNLISPGEVTAKAQELLSMVELPPEYADRYARDMSGGQRQRVGIARALALEPDLLICDEVTSALDVCVQKKIVDLLLKLQKEKNITMAMVCHDIALVRAVAHRTAVMYLGNVVEIVPGPEIGAGELCHPYTRALRDSIFTIDMDFTKPIESIESEAPSPLDVPAGCPFRNRCEHCTERCALEKPKLRTLAPGHQIACHLYDDLPEYAGEE
ncbi:MAG: ABC transporter ATP-binding protein [Oscillospiraceae bacterium]|nr:ABC transporter ATP-binding protein [Oscillospiraceae bacterium]